METLILEDRLFDTIEEILVEFSLRGAVVVFSEHGEESLMKLPMHSYDLSGRCVGW